MAQSVKLKDGSYIDTAGVYDVTQGKTQEAVNAGKQDVLKYKDVQIKAVNNTFTYYSGGKYVCNIALSTLIGAFTRTFSVTITKWSQVQSIENIMLDGNGGVLSIFTNVDSPIFVITVRIVYV